MAIEVATNENVDLYTSGTKWVIDSERMLHVIGDDKNNLASYACNCWENVRHTQ